MRWLLPGILLLAFSACDGGESARGVDSAAISAARARTLYLAKCAICHGERGDGQGPRRGSLFRKPPDFRRPAWRQGKSLAELRSAIREGRPGSDMPAWKTLDDAEIAGLAAYVAGLAEAGGGGSE